MTSPICPPRLTIKPNLENRSKVNRLTVTIELAAQWAEEVVFKSMESVQAEDRISSIKFNFSMRYRVSIYDNLKGIYQKTGEEIRSSSNQAEFFSYRESNTVKTESHLTQDLSSEIVKNVFFQSMRWHSNTSGTFIEFKFITESRVLEKPICKVLEDSSEEVPHYVEMQSRKAIGDSIYGVLSCKKLLGGLLSIPEEDLATEEPIYYEELGEGATNESSEQSSSPCYVEIQPRKSMGDSIHEVLSYNKSFGRLSSIPEEDLVTEEPIYEELGKGSTNESSEQISSGMHFQEVKTGEKKSKNLLKRFLGLFKCIAKKPKNNVLIKSLEQDVRANEPIDDEVQKKTKERTISEDSGYASLAAPRESISDFSDV